MPKADLNDLISHRAAWRKAIQAMVNLANPAKRVGFFDSDDADYSYWLHELEVFDRTFALIGPKENA